MSFKESQAGKFYMGGNKENYIKENGLLLPEDLLQRDIEKQKEIKEAEQARAMYMKLQEEKQKELDAKLATLELIPMWNKVIILPYPRNPYKKIIEGKIIIEYDGEFNNPDTGEKDKQDVFVGCAKVIEIGPTTEYLQPGDDVFYDTRTCYPVPFMSQGYIMTTETQILCVLNEGLKKRFKMNLDMPE